MWSYEINKTTIKRHLISGSITFLTAFCVTLLAQWDSLTLEAIKGGAWVSVLFTAVRAGVKAIIEAFLTWRTLRK